MIQPEQIPDEVVEAALEAFAHASGLGIFPDDEKDEDWREDLQNGMRAAIAAAIRAWPGAYPVDYGGDDLPFLVLPLPQEDRT